MEARTADGETFGFVDLVVRQGEMWGALSPGRWLAPHLKGGQKIWTAQSDWAELLHGPFVAPPAVRVLADVGFEADPERMVAHYQSLVAIEPHPAVWGVMITHKGLTEERCAYWQLPVLSGEAPRWVSADAWQAIADEELTSGT